MRVCIAVEAARSGDDQATANGFDDLHGDVDALAGADATDKQEIIILVAENSKSSRSK